MLSTARHRDLLLGGKRCTTSVAVSNTRVQETRYYRVTRRVSCARTFLAAVGFPVCGRCFGDALPARSRARKCATIKGFSWGRTSKCFNVRPNVLHPRLTASQGILLCFFSGSCCYKARGTKRQRVYASVVCTNGQVSTRAYLARHCWSISIWCEHAQKAYGKETR